MYPNLPFLSEKNSLKVLIPIYIGTLFGLKELYVIYYIGL
jgi:hypothetical protein